MELLIYSSVGLAIGILGVVGNALVLVVAWTKRKDTATKFLKNPYLLSLTSKDLVSSVLMIPTFTLTFIKPPSENTPRILVQMYCFVGFSEGLVGPWLIASTIGLIALTFDRYLIVVYQDFHKKYCTKKLHRVIIPCLWIIPVSIVMIWYGLTTDVYESYCTFTNERASMYFHWFSFAAFFVLPLTVFVGCYSHMLVYLVKKTSSVAPGGGQAAVTTNAKQGIALTMFLVCLSFVLTWSPSQIYYTLMLTGDVPVQQDISYLSTVLLAYSNSIINPVIYFYRMKELRKALCASCRNENNVVAPGQAN